MIQKNLSLCARKQVPWVFEMTGHGKIAAVIPFPRDDEVCFRHCEEPFRVTKQSLLYMTTLII